MNQKQDRRDESVPAPERPAGEWPCRLSEGKQRSATCVRRDSLDHARGPAIQGLGLAVAEFGSGRHMGPEPGFVRAEENNGSLPDAVIGFRVKQPEHVQPFRAGCACHFLDHHGLQRATAGFRADLLSLRRLGRPEAITSTGWTAFPPCGPSSRTFAACPRWSSGSPRRCGHAWGSCNAQSAPGRTPEPRLPSVKRQASE